MAPHREELQKEDSNESVSSDPSSDMKSKLVIVNKSTKKTEHVVPGTKIQVNNMTLLVRQLKEELKRTKADLISEKNQRHDERHGCEQRIQVFKAKCNESDKKLCKEQKVRQEKEKKVSLEILSLAREVQELTLYKRSATKQIEELEEKVKITNGRLQIQKEELVIAKRFEKNADHLDNELRQYKDVCECTQSEKERVVKELERYQKQAEAYRREKEELARENAELKNKNKNEITAIQTQENLIQKLQEHIKSLQVELEDTDRENEMQCEEIKKLKTILETKNDVIQNVEERVENDRKLAMTTGRELAHLRESNQVLLKKVTQQTVQTKKANTLKARISQKLSKAEAEITFMSGIIKQLNSDIEDLSTIINNKNLELVELQRDNFRTKSHVHNVTTKLAETKRAEEMHKVAVYKEKTRSKNAMVNMMQQQDQLEKELQHSNKQLLRQEQTIHCQDQEKAELADRIEEYREKTTYLSQSNMKLKNECEKTQTKLVSHLRQKTLGISKESMFIPDKKSDESVSLNKVIEKQRRSLEEKEAELKELRDKGNVSTSEKGVQDHLVCQRAKRELKEKLMALEGCLALFKDRSKTETEVNKRLTEESKRLTGENKRLTWENKRLTDELRKVKLENAKLSKLAPLASITSQHTSKDQCSLPRHQHYLTKSTKGPLQAAQKFGNVSNLPKTSLFCQGRQLCHQ